MIGNRYLNNTHTNYCNLIPIFGTRMLSHSCDFIDLEFLLCFIFFLCEKPQPCHNNRPNRIEFNRKNETRRKSNNLFRRIGIRSSQQYKFVMILQIHQVFMNNRFVRIITMKTRVVQHICN